MIISREDFNKLDEEEVLIAMHNFNQTNYNKFNIENDILFIYNEDGTQAIKSSYNGPCEFIRRMLMTHEEFVSEVKAGSFPEITYDEKTRRIYY